MMMINHNKIIIYNTNILYGFFERTHKVPFLPYQQEFVEVFVSARDVGELQMASDEC